MTFNSVLRIFNSPQTEFLFVLQAPVRGDGSEIKIVDWEGSRSEVQADLLRAAVRLAGPARVSIWSATLAESARELLREAGFRPVGPQMATTIYKKSLLVRPVGEAMLNEDWSLAGCRLLDLSNWDLRELYSQ